MAKTYNIREMADAFNGKDYAAQADFGARYPLVAIKMAALFAKAPEEAYDFCMAMPEYLTGQKLNGAFKDACQQRRRSRHLRLRRLKVE